MPSNEMEIILTLVDKATAEFKSSIHAMSEENKTAIKSLQSEFDKSQKKSQETTDTIRKGFKDSAQEIRQFRRDLLLVVSAFVAVYNATKTFAKYNEEARVSVNEITKSFANASVSVGMFLNRIGAIELFEKSAAGFERLMNLITGKGFIEENTLSDQIMSAKFAIDEVNNKLKDAELLYRSGAMSAQEFYSIISTNAMLSVDARNQEISQLRELATLTSQVNNQAAMEAMTRTNQQISLLKEYQANYQIAHSKMSDFTVMLSRTIRTHMSSALADVMLGTKRAKDAFAEFGQTMIRVIVEYMAQKMVAWVLEKTLLAGTTASSIAAANAISAAWAQAALYVSLATMGTNAIGAAAGIMSTAGVLAGASALVTAISSANRIGVNVSSAVGQSSPEGYASGGWAGLRGPELAWVGEREPELIIPQSRLNQGSLGGVNISIQINNPMVQNSSDIDDLVNAISDRLARETERYY